jgi:hypothetical protein
MNKDFIPYEQAVALKELGFDEPCIYYVDEQNNSFIYNFQTHPDEFIAWCGVKVISTPTYSQAFNWFREKYQLHSYIEGAYPWFRFYINTEDNRYEGHKHLSFEEAELECLKNLIQLIK